AQHRLLVGQAATFSIEREKQIFRKPAAPDRSRKSGRRTPVVDNKPAEFSGNLASANMPSLLRQKILASAAGSATVSSILPARRSRHVPCTMPRIEKEKMGRRIQSAPRFRPALSAIASLRRAG